MGWFCCCQKKYDEKGKDVIIDCPRCHRPMTKKSSMGVTIDKCEKCQGIWLDKGEIENIIKKIDDAQLSAKASKAKSKKTGKSK